MSDTTRGFYHPMIEVTAADREAACRYLKANENYWIDAVSSINANNAAGDAHPLVQAFAAHRIAAIRGMKEKVDG